MSFTRTRVRSFSVAACGVLLLGFAPPAQAADVDLVTDDVALVNRAVFDMGQLQNAGGYQEAVVVRNGSLGDRVDAFDGGMAVVVENQGVTAPDRTAHLQGRSLSYDPQKVAGLRVSGAYRALAGTTTLRLLVTVKNPGKQSRRRNIGMESDLGSDAATVLQGTSTTDTFFSTRDRWLVTSDATPSTGDVVVGQVYGGPGDVARRVGALGNDGNQLTAMVTSVRIPAKQTRFLLFFVTFADSAAAGLASMQPFDRRHLPKKLLGGISAREQRQVLNWDL